MCSKLRHFRVTVKYPGGSNRKQRVLEIHHKTVKTVRKSKFFDFFSFFYKKKVDIFIFFGKLGRCRVE